MGECVRALLIEKIEVKYEWGGERWNRIPFSAKQLLLSPLHIAYADTKVALWSGGRAGVWGDMRLMFYAFRSTLLIVLARWDYF
jgi:hypothetical protein